MHTFHDNQKREWRITINVGTVKTVKAITGIDLLNLFTDDAHKLFGDIILFVDCLYVLCKHQVEARHMTDIEFGEALTGDSLEEASQSLMNEIADFFPQKRREILRKLMMKVNAATDKTLENLNTKIDKLDISTLLDKSTSSPESSA